MSRAAHILPTTLALAQAQAHTQTQAQSLAQRDEATDSGAALIDAAAARALPTSFGVFKPVGHMMVGLPLQAQLTALVSTLRNAGWAAAALRQFSPVACVEELRAMVAKAGVLAGFGYEITALRRYVSLTDVGYRWLLVQADDTDSAMAAAQLAQHCGATLAVYYRRLTVEDLIH
jgi:hypothetical protein